MKDYFSGQAEGYARFRPQYPDALYQFILSKSKENDLAWDCGTGNGQTARELVKYFKQVYASDISEKQIEQAYQSNHIRYAIEPAEKTSLLNGTVNLVTVSQALHWFDVDEFYAEVKRVCKPNGLLTAWTYQLLQVDPQIDERVTHFYTDILGKYWDEARKHVDDGYASIHFPFKQIPAPAFSIEVIWTLADIEGFLKTWSAVQKFITVNGYDPVDDLILSLAETWKPGEERNVRFPVCLKMAYVNEALQVF
jgi:ubiquinone/menaquinone biosynthesis C-methylase UbiE